MLRIVTNQTYVNEELLDSSCELIPDQTKSAPLITASNGFEECA